MKANSYQRSRKRGLAIVEFAASLSVIFPLALLMIYIVFEACQFVFITNCLSEAARAAARGCAVAYGAPSSGTSGSADAQGPAVAPSQPSAVYSNPSTIVVEGTNSGAASNPPKSPNDAFTQIRIKNVVSDNSQFSAAYTPPAPNNQDPTYSIGRVTVTVTYKGTFPNPDPLNLVSRLSNLKLTESCSYPLEF
ncbi:MAG: hypothetical protein JST89_16495 [Cyanobacteria bacterium SZAS-4]|nr:hypothetical protein [Cyanobacteria bacterium SZAS-4]